MTEVTKEHKTELKVSCSAVVLFEKVLRSRSAEGRSGGKMGTMAKNNSPTHKSKDAPLDETIRTPGKHREDTQRWESPMPLVS